jgi:hypothetical protein
MHFGVILYFILMFVILTFMTVFLVPINHEHRDCTIQPLWK